MPFVAGLEFCLQFIGCIEVVFDRSLVPTCDENHLANASGVGFFHSVLNQRLVDHRQHFFGNGLGGRQKTRSQPPTGNTALVILGMSDLDIFMVVRIETVASADGHA